jgi:hypothetical protein
MEWDPHSSVGELELIQDREGGSGVAKGLECRGSHGVYVKWRPEWCAELEDVRREQLSAWSLNILSFL